MNNSKNEKRFWIILALLVVAFVLLRLPSLFEPHWHSDEGLYANFAENMEQGHILYRDIFDHKPPFIFYLYMVGDHASRFFWAKLLSMTAGLLGLWGIAQLVRKCFGSRQALFAATLYVVLIGTPILSANTANTENFFVPLVIWATLLTMSTAKNRLFWAGSMLGLAIWWKPVALFDFIAIGIFLALTAIESWSWQALKNFVRAHYQLLLGFIWPSVIVLLIQISQSNLGNFFEAVVTANLRYIGETGDQGALMAILASLPFRAVLTASMLLLWVLLYHRKYLHKYTLLALLLLTLETFGAFSSGRGYNHYLQQAVPGFILLCMCVVGRVSQLKSSWHKALIAAVIPAITALLLAVFLINGDVSKGEISEKLNYYPDFLVALRGGEAYEYAEAFRASPIRAAEFAAILGPQERQSLYIYSLDCWAYYDLQVPPQVFYLNPFHMYVFANEARPRTLSELEQNNVQYILVEKSFGVVPELQEYIDQNFEMSKESERLVLYERKLVNM